MRFASDFYISKTTWTAAVAILTAVIAYIDGHLNGQITVGGILMAALAAFLRDAVAKNTEAIESLVLVEDGEEPK